VATFSKEERLCSEVLISRLFKNGNTFASYPVRIVWLFVDDDAEAPARVLFSVSKKNVKLAVTRNLIRRRMREVYRKNKESLYESLQRMNRKCLLALIFTGNKVHSSAALEPKIILSLQRLIRENEKNSR
jgi:ribonuclease P protein component